MSTDKFRRRLVTGETLFVQGELGHEAYVVESGSIEISTRSGTGRSVLARLGKDDILGEMALAGNLTRTASAVATEPTTLVVVTHEYLAERLADADPLVRHLLSVTLARSRDSLRRARGDADAETARPTTAATGTDTPDDRTLALKRLRLEQDLERALERNEFVLHYQPIVRLSDGTVAGFESLIRWLRSDGTRVAPDQFIGVAEDSGLIVQIGHWVIRSACKAVAQLRAAQPKAVPRFVNINLSIRQLSDPDLFSVLKQALAQEGVPASLLKLEITESLVMSNMDASLELMRQCKELGCKLVVDDFGTGYSSLSYLHKFPVDVLKLDRSFIKEVVGNEQAAKIVRAVAGLAADLGMETVVEGVETSEQADICRRIGIQFAQGFRYSPALPLPEALVYLDVPPLPQSAAPAAAVECAAQTL